MRQTTIRTLQGDDERCGRKATYEHPLALAFRIASMISFFSTARLMSMLYELAYILSLLNGIPRKRPGPAAVTICHWQNELSQRNPNKKLDSHHLRARCSTHRREQNRSRYRTQNEGAVPGNRSTNDNRNTLGRMMNTTRRTTTKWKAYHSDYIFWISRRRD